MRVRRREVIEEIFAPGQHVVGDLERLEQIILRKLTTLSALLATSQTRDGELIRDRYGWIPDAHHDISEIAFNSCQGSDGSSLACGKVRAIQICIATFSLSVWPSITSSGTLCLGLIFMYSADLCWSFRMLSGRTSNFAFASVSVT